MQENKRSEGVTMQDQDEQSAEGYSLSKLGLRNSRALAMFPTKPVRKMSLAL